MSLIYLAIRCDLELERVTLETSFGEHQNRYWKPRGPMFLPNRCRFGKEEVWGTGLAQWVERATLDLLVMGSSPTLGGELT